MAHVHRSVRMGLGVAKWYDRRDDPSITIPVTGVATANTSPNRRNVIAIVPLSAPIAAKCGSIIDRMQPLPNQQSMLSARGTKIEGDWMQRWANE